jgi:signal peptidase II|tara:strand:+ start:247 stop:744 length:498 start_codon:yes stop_codon:yes gene_type:complete
MIIKNLRKNFIINLSLILLIFLLDRISKIYVIFLDKKFLGSEIFSSKFLNIQLFWNEGIAFGLFSLKQGKLYNFLTIIIMILIILILYLAFKSNGIKKYSLLLIFGGAIGNLYDRIFYNAVPDFIDLHIGNFHWFIFNVADIFITIGVIFMILLEFTATNNKLKI